MKVFTSKMIAVAIACTTFSAFARSPFMEKLDEMKSAGVPVDISAYEREEIYEKQNLSFDQRASLESQKLVEEISLTVIEAYEAALKHHQNEQAAKEEIVMAISKDTGLADAQLQAELRRISLTILESHMRGEAISENLLEGSRLYSYFKDQSIQRANILKDSTLFAQELGNKDDDKGLQREFKNNAELVSSLTSTKSNAPFPSSSTVTIKSGRQYTTATSISAQVSLEFLGSRISAGPTISFKRTYSSEVVVMALGLNPVLLSDGNFDLYKRDSNGKILKSRGNPIRRDVSFNCAAQVNFSSDYKGEGGFKIMGMGADVSVTQNYSNSVGLDSRRITIPDYVGGKSVTMSYLSKLCHNDFLNARIAGGTVKKQLDVMMKNVIGSLVFSHPKTKCATDNDCVDWYNNEVISWHKSRTFPRCAPEASGREKFNACTLRGLSGSNCSIYKDGKRTSTGSFEYTCDKGLKCVQTQEGGWFSHGQIKSYDEGKCKPINSKTYVSPLESDYIQIRFAK